ncbi:MAG: biotin/lipoyl-binding protein, partial [Gammaproteobacteria bacterium]
MVEENISTPQHEKTHTNRLKRNRILSLMAVIFLLLAIGYVIYWLVWGRLEIFTDDAYVNGNIVKLMPQISGTVVSINTDDTHLVKTGQILIKLDDTDAKIAFQHASAALAVTVRQVKQYYENAAAAQSMLIIRQADLVKAQLDFKRRSGLVGDRAISREEMQHYRTSLDAASAQYDIASHKLGSALALVENTHLYQHPLVIQAKTNFKTAYLNLQRTTIVAPVMGYIAKRNVEVGQQVDPSTWMLAIIP